MNDFSVKLDVVLGERNTGKTTDLLKIALQKMEEGRDVLFVCPYQDMARMIFRKLQEELSFAYIYYGYTSGEYNLTVHNGKGNKIKFMSLETLKSVNFTPREYIKPFVILDNAEMMLPEADIISINGNYAKPTLDGVRNE